ncbi:hypothetical protein PoB_005502100 [Plakobranchus ocellatus]|uniref:Uncharacterized protein n=1 Tax=Plakobranchus ocellatus TaxID=259542 RepID=A0AAV4CB08_9GAST|nr:hypothetical protein PoB_005502100 [Plakobranchus ocellatus]
MGIEEGAGSNPTRKLRPTYLTRAPGLITVYSRFIGDSLVKNPQPECNARISPYLRPAADASVSGLPLHATDLQYLSLRATGSHSDLLIDLNCRSRCLYAGVL